MPQLYKSIRGTALDGPPSREQQWRFVVDLTGAFAIPQRISVNVTQAMLAMLVSRFAQTSDQAVSESRGHALGMQHLPTQLRRILGDGFWQM